MKQAAAVLLLLCVGCASSQNVTSTTLPGLDVRIQQRGDPSTFTSQEPIPFIIELTNRTGETVTVKHLVFGTLDAFEHFPPLPLRAMPIRHFTIAYTTAGMNRTIPAGATEKVLLVAAVMPPANVTEIADPVRVDVVLETPGGEQRGTIVQPFALRPSTVAMR